jgi:hypothetical protein
LQKFKLLGINLAPFLRLTSIYTFIAFCLIFEVVFHSCTSDAGKSGESGMDVSLKEIRIASISTDRNSEISGLCWYDDELIVLPQYPHYFMENDTGMIFKISKSKIINYLDNQEESVINPDKIQIVDLEVLSGINGFQGFEAITVLDEYAYFTIEAKVSRQMQSYLISGKIINNSNRIVLQPESLMPLQIPRQVPNMTFESLLSYNGKVIAIFESNGSKINPNPVALEIDPNTRKVKQIQFPNIEYRLTDATNCDALGNFWVTNYYWPGEFFLFNPESDRFNSGKTENRKLNVDKAIERIIQLRIKNDKIEIGDAAPIYLQTEDEKDGRNWEGIARLDDRGFIIATDKFPRTIIAFLPL